MGGSNMKKWFKLLTSILLVFSLTACGENGTDEGKNKDTEEMHENHDQDDKVKESEIGKLTVVKQKKDLNQTIKSGPMNITITSIQAATLQPNDEYKEAFFDNKDEVTIVTIAMKVENTSEDTISIYPNQAALTTNTGEQVDADMLLSDDIGGEFFGKVNKEGDVIFQLDAPADEITKVKYIVDGAHDTDYNSLSDQIQVDLEF